MLSLIASLLCLCALFVEGNETGHGGLRRLRGIGMIDPRTVEMKVAQQQEPPGSYDTGALPQQIGGYNDGDPTTLSGHVQIYDGDAPPPGSGGADDPSGQIQQEGTYLALPQQGIGQQPGHGQAPTLQVQPDGAYNIEVSPPQQQEVVVEDSQQGFESMPGQEQQQQPRSQQDIYGVSPFDASHGNYATPAQEISYDQQQAPSLLQPRGYVTEGYTPTDEQPPIVPQSHSQYSGTPLPALSKEEAQNKIEVASKDKPSFGLLCDKVLERHHDKATNGSLYIVQEDPEVCTNTDTFQSLYTMMVSTIIAQGGSIWRVSYQHNCKPPVQDSSVDITKATIQQMLPNDLSLAMGAGMETVAEMCKEWHHDKKSGIQAMGFPVEGVIETPDPVVNVNRASAFRHNVQSAVQNILREESKLHQVPNMDRVVVIYLDTESPTRGLTALDFDYYITSVPREAAGVDIVMSQTCQANSHCEKYGRLLQKSLAENFSHIPVTMELVSGTATAYARIMEAPILLCPATLACLLPAMWKDVFTMTVLKEEPDLFPWYRYMVREAKKSFHLHIEYEKEEK